MQPLELALFVAVVALALGLVGSIVWPYLRARRGGKSAALTAMASDPATSARAPSLVCPACHREFEPGLQFCPHDARDLVLASDPSLRAPAPGMTCPTCRRSYDPGKRFCSFDGEELVPLALAIGPGEFPTVAFAGALGKICPSCSRRYENDATFCGRDGADLVSVN